MYVSYCYVSYKYCTAIQETRIPSEMCAGEHVYITDGKHTSLVICVRGNTHPQGYVSGKHLTRTHPYMTPAVLLKEPVWSLTALTFLSITSEEA